MSTNRKKALIITAVAAALVILIATLFFAFFGKAPRDVYRANKAALNSAVQSILSGKPADSISISGIKSVSYWDGENAIIEFSIPTLVNYKGLYYSVSGKPAAFQNANVPLNEADDGWVWVGTGDNKGKTANIEGNWYSYEASL